MGLYKNQNGVLVPIAGRGKAEYGASTTRSGSAPVPAIVAGGIGNTTVTFDTPMPDGDYIVEISSGAKYVAAQISTNNRNANGFRFNIYNLSDTDISEGQYNIRYTAYKLYTDVEYNNILNAMPSTANSTYKLLDKKVPRFSVAEDLSNALLNMPAQSQLDFAIGASKLVVGGATFPLRTSWHVYSDGSGTSTFGGIGYRYNPNYTELYHLVGGKSGLTLTLNITSVNTTDTGAVTATRDDNGTTGGELYYRIVGKTVFVNLSGVTPKVSGSAVQIITGLPPAAIGAYGMAVKAGGSPVDITLWVDNGETSMRMWCADTTKPAFYGSLVYSTY